MTEVQARTIPALLLGRDVLGAARTGVCDTSVRHAQSNAMLSLMPFIDINLGTDQTQAGGNQIGPELFL